MQNRSGVQDPADILRDENMFFKLDIIMIFFMETNA